LKILSYQNVDGRSRKQARSNHRRKIISSVLYAITGLVLGYEAYMSIMWAVWGAPQNPADDIALGGAFVLMIASGVVWRSYLGGAFVALVGFALIWVDAGPAVLTEIQHPQDYSVIFIAVMGLLIIATGYAVCVALTAMKYLLSNVEEL
jgi:hypothetical protein